MQQNDPGHGSHEQESSGQRREERERETRGEEPIELPGGGVLQGESEDESRPELELGFGDLVRPFLMMGLTGVGVLPHPDSGRPAIDLQAAKHAIGVLELLAERSEGHRSDEESQMLDQALFELKMHFVEAQRRPKKE